MRLAPIAVLMLLPLAGCLGEPADREPGPEEDGRPGLTGNRTEARTAGGWLNETFTIVQSGFGPNQVEGSNCVHFDHQELDRVLSGWVEASWTTPSPTSQPMRLEARGEGAPVAARGDSPLRLELADLRPHPQLDLVVYLRTDLAAGADVQVDMRLQWSIQYEGADTLAVQKFTCG